MTVSVDKPTRQCTTLLDGKTGEMTELIVNWVLYLLYLGAPRENITGRKGCS
jgi:hypothetical protein